MDLIYLSIEKGLENKLYKCEVQWLLMACVAYVTQQINIYEMGRLFVDFIGIFFGKLF